MIVLLCATVFPPFQAPDEVARNGRTNRILSCSYILDAFHLYVTEYETIRTISWHLHRFENRKSRDTRQKVGEGN